VSYVRNHMVFVFPLLVSMQIEIIHSYDDMICRVVSAGHQLNRYELRGAID